MQMNKTDTQGGEKYSENDMIYGSGSSETTKPWLDEDETTSQMLKEVPAPHNDGVSAGVVIGIILSIAIILIVVVFAYRRQNYLQRKRRSPYHVPIIEYREDGNADVSTRFSSSGYGTYRDLEDHPINEEFSTRIEGKLALQSLHNNI